MTSSSRTAVMDAQRSWALAADHLPDENGYLENLEDNLFQPLSAKARQGLSEGSGSELIDRDGEKAKFKALHSSSALAVNVFDFFMANNRSCLAKALGLENTITSLDFEEKFPTGLRGTPPNLDVVLRLDDGTVIGVESKFTEWMDAVTGKAQFRASYFPDGKGLWAGKGLPCSQRLAGSIHAEEECFLHLNTAQLLKHALGLANMTGRKFRLYYIYFESPGPESEMHRDEIKKFELLVGEELHFRATTYQALFSKLSGDHELEEGYKRYLAERYFQEQVI